MLSVPTRPVRRSSAADSTSASRSNSGPDACANRNPAAVGSIPRPTRCSSVSPVSRASAATCWLTADGVYPRWAAAAWIDPAATTARNTRSRATSIMAGS